MPLYSLVVEKTFHSFGDRPSGAEVVTLLKVLRGGVAKLTDDDLESAVELAGRIQLNWDARCAKGMKMKMECIHVSAPGLQKEEAEIVARAIFSKHFSLTMRRRCFVGALIQEAEGTAFEPSVTVVEDDQGGAT